MSKGYSESTLVEQPANEIFAGMGWQTIGVFDEVSGEGGTLGRESAGEVVLARLSDLFQGCLAGGCD